MKEMNGQLRVLLDSLGFASERRMPVDKRFTNYAGEFLHHGRGRSNLWHSTHSPEKQRQAAYYRVRLEAVCVRRMRIRN